MTVIRTFVLFMLALGIAGFGAVAAEPTAELKPGTVFRDCATCPELVVIPSGKFFMGLNGKEPRELPIHSVTISKPFAMGRYEVLFDEWEVCANEGVCAPTPHDHNWGKGRRPVMNLFYDDMVVYTKWLSKKTGKTYRLPTEAEWEYADRAGTITNYWWGDEVGVNNANCKDCGTEWSAKGSAPAGSFKPNPFGLFDTTGNEWEWVQDCWNPTHKGAPGDGSARLTGDCTQRVMRGGSWYYFSKNSRSSYRSKNAVTVKGYGISFRVLRELP